MTKKQAKARPKKRAKGGIDENELAALVAQQATDAADDKKRSSLARPARDVGRRTVVRADDDDGPLTLRDDTDLENDNSAGLGLTAKERAEDRKEHVARIKGQKGKGARPRRGEVFGRVPPRPTTVICTRCEWRACPPIECPPSRRVIVQSRRTANPRWVAMWTGAVGGVWVGLRQIKVVYRLVYDVPNTPPRRFLHYISAEATDVPILKWRHLILSRRSAGWAGSRDSVPTRECTWLVVQATWANICREGLKGCLPWFTRYLWLKETAPPPEVSPAVEAFYEQLCDVWRSIAQAEDHAKNSTRLRKAFAKLAENPEAAEEYDRFPPPPPTESYPSGKWRIRPFFPRLASIAAYPPPKPARLELLKRDRHRDFSYRSIRPSNQGKNNKRWSSAVVDNEIKKRVKALLRTSGLGKRNEEANTSEAKCEWVEVAPHQYVNKTAVDILRLGELQAKLPRQHQRGVGWLQVDGERWVPGEERSPRNRQLAVLWEDVRRKWEDVRRNPPFPDVSRSDADVRWHAWQPAPQEHEQRPLFASTTYPPELTPRSKWTDFIPDPTDPDFLEIVEWDAVDWAILSGPAWDFCPLGRWRADRYQRDSGRGDSTILIRATPGAGGWIGDPRAKLKKRLAEQIVDQQIITESRHCTSVYDNRKSAVAEPGASAWRGWRLFLEGALKPRALLSALVQDFEARGGEIQICPPGKLSVERRKRGRPPIGEVKMSNKDKQKRYRANKKLKMQTSPTLSTTQTASAVGAGVVGPCPTRAVDAGILSVAKDKP